MTKENKIFIGIGLAAIAYLIYKSKATATATATAEKSKPVQLTQEEINKAILPVQLTQEGINQGMVLCNDGTKDIGNGIVAPCIGHGGERGSTTTTAIFGTKNQYCERAKLELADLQQSMAMSRYTSAGLASANARLAELQKQLSACI